MDYAKAASLNPTSVKTRYQLALALENINDLSGAKEQLMVILRDLDHYNALAYNEIGRVILESGPTDMSEFQAAVESFKTAIKLDPNLVGAEEPGAGDEDVGDVAPGDAQRDGAELATVKTA